VIDFIDMENNRNQRDVEDRLRDSLHYDRARVQTAKISRFGLLELSRQRLAPSLGESNYMPCPRCSGIGHIRGIESSALHILRIIQEEAMKESSAAIHVQVPVDVATFLLNEKRSDIHRIESRLKVGITLIPNPHLETPNYSISRLRQDDMTSDVLQASYKLVEKPAEEKPLSAAQEQQKATRAQAVVQGVTPMQPAPMKAEAAQPSMFGKFFTWIKSLAEEEQPKAKPAASRPRNAPRPEGGGKRRGRGERSEGGGNRDRNEPRSGQKPAQAEAKPQEPRQPKPPRPPRVAAEGSPKAPVKGRTRQANPFPAESWTEAPPPDARPSGGLGAGGGGVNSTPGLPGSGLPAFGAPVLFAGAEEKPVLESQVAAAAIELAEAGSPPRDSARRRGRRGGRREREHREIAAQNAAALATNGEAVIVQQSFEQMDTAPVSVGPTEYIAFPDGFAKPSEYIAMPTIFTPSLPAVVTPPPVAKTSGNGHGLVQIETDPVKLSTVAQVTATSAERHPPRRRERQREVYVENEPLVQIETQHPQG
jgi:ribonuclease E